MLLAQDLQARTDAELAQMAATLDPMGQAIIFVREEIEFRERHPEYRVA